MLIKLLNLIFKSLTALVVVNISSDKLRATCVLQKPISHSNTNSSDSG